MKRRDFVRKKEISVDLNYAQPRIRMLDDKKGLVEEFTCNNRKDADVLFDQLISVWSQVRREEGKINET